MMITRIHSWMVCALILCLHPSAQSQAFNPNLAARLQTVLDSMVTALPNTVGMTVGVYCPGQGLWKGGSGISHSGTPIHPDMEMGIASNSKLFITVTLLKMAEDNLLSLDDSLHSWIPNFANVDPNITIRQLLSNTSGIFDPFFGTALLDSIDAHPTHVYTINEVMSYVGAPLFAPGTNYGYSNTNFILAGLVAENAAGIPAWQSIRNRILQPLQLDSTFYDVAEAPVGTLAHRWYNGVDFHDTSRVSLNTAVGAAGSLFSTAGEMAQWYHALMSGQVLDAGSFAEMTNFGTPGNYGLGLLKSTYFGNTCWGHGGTTNGYRSRAIYDPCMQAAVIGLSNSNPSAVDGITATLYKVLVDNLPECGATLSGTASVCRGQTGVTYTVPAISGATSYVWTLPPGATGNSITNSITVDFDMTAVSGPITVSGNNSFGVGAPATFDVNVQVIPTGTTLNNTTISADSSADTYQWVDCGNGFQAIAGATNASFTPDVTGSYAVVMTRGACSDTSACTPVVIVGIDKGQVGNISFYPNPFTEVLTIRCTEGDMETSFDMLNAIGQPVYRGVLVDETRIVTSGLAAGMYFVRFADGTTYKVLK